MNRRELAIQILKIKLKKKNNVISMSKLQITLNFSNLMIAHNELSLFEFRNSFFFTIQLVNIIIYLRFSDEFLNIFYCQRRIIRS